MQSSEFHENLESRDISFFKLLVLLGSIFIVNYFAIKGTLSTSSSLVLFIALGFVLLKINPVFCFVYSFVLHVDVMGCFGFNWAKFMTFAGMYTVFITDSKSLTELFEDKKLKIIFFLGLIFGIYVLIINIGLKSDLNLGIILQKFGTIFGFLSILPAYYFTVKQPKDLFLSLTFIAATFLFLYYLSLFKGLNLFKLENTNRNTGANIDRLSGYDIRQFIIFYAYLIPASLLANNIKSIFKYFIISIGVFSYIVLVLAFYRTAMFFVAMGAIISLVYIRKYSKTGKILKIFFFFIILILIANIFFGEYLTEINNLFSATIDYFQGKGQDNSADTRFEYQLPILTGLIESNFWTGIGLIEMDTLMSLDMMGMVDIPVLGTLATFGVLGMFLYYLKFIFLLFGKEDNIEQINNSFDIENPFIFYLYLTLKAYIITMITFRLFYISWELAMVYQLAEFGLFAGVFLAIQKIKRELYEEKIYLQNMSFQSN